MTAALPVPCIHRVHQGEALGALRIHHELGVSIEREVLLDRLESLERAAERSGLDERSVLVTFDDGWADPTELVPALDRLPHLQPVLFLTNAQLRGDRALLPLPRLYEWCAAEGRPLAELASVGVTRSGLKRLPEEEQHAILDGLGVPRAVSSPHMLSLTQVRALVDAGWRVGSHGHDHHDLRYDEPQALLRGLQEALEVVVAFGGEPWLAWPEGRCTEETCVIAWEAGFATQFSLRVEAGGLDSSDLVHREIWR